MKPNLIVVVLLLAGYWAGVEGLEYAAQQLTLVIGVILVQFDGLELEQVQRLEQEQ